jgi:hypothetical protein
MWECSSYNHLKSQPLVQLDPKFCKPSISFNIKDTWLPITKISQAPMLRLQQKEQY